MQLFGVDGTGLHVFLQLLVVGLSQESKVLFHFVTESLLCFQLRRTKEGSQRNVHVSGVLLKVLIYIGSGVIQPFSCGA